MAGRSLSHVIGFDDSPFPHAFRGEVTVIGTFFAGPRLDGVLSCRVHRDGDDSARRLAELVESSRFAPQVRLVMLQGVALAGFNVVDAFALRERLALPVLIVARRAPDFERIREALLTRVEDGARKWSIIERLGPMEPIAGVHVQRVGLSLDDAERVIARTALHGRIPEPLRVAHLIAGGVATGESRGRA